METKDQTESPGVDEASEQASQESKQKASQELIDELTRLGQKFAEVIEVAWNSDQRKKIEDDLRNGLNSMAASLEKGVKHAASSKEAKEFRDKAEDVAERVRENKVSSELADALSQALRKVSDALDDVAKDIKEKQPDSKAHEDDDGDSQDIPITKV